MGKKPKIQIVGKTNNGKLVVSGLFRLFDTRGVPLDVLFEQCEKSNWLPSWCHFYEEAKSYGWKHKTIITRLSDSIADIYGHDYRNIVIERLNKTYEPRKT